MPLRAEKAAPLQGVKGVKPCLRQPKISRRPETPETVRLNEEYLTKRNKILDLKYKREAMNLALDRDRSIDKRLVERHLSYLAIAMRQKLLAISAKLYSCLGKERFLHEAARECEKFIHEVLNY